MFFDYLGKYFAPALAKADLLADGARCAICGGRGIALSASPTTGVPVCLAQTTITRKRADRGSPDVPPDPPPAGKRAVTGLEGAAAVAGPHVAWMISKVHAETVLPPHVRADYLTSGAGQVRAMLRQIVLAPPRPPFVVLLLGKSSGFRVEITEHPSFIRINGPNEAWVDAERLRRVLPRLEGCRRADVELLTELQRAQLAGEASPRVARLRMSLAERHAALPSLLRDLPQPPEPEYRLMNQMLA